MDTGSILIIDAHSSMRNVLKNIFKDDYTILEADSEETALHMLEYASDVVLIFSSESIAKVNDFSLIFHLKNDRKYLSIPIVIHTPVENSNEQTTLLNMGVADFIEEPYRPLIIRKRMERIISDFNSNLERTNSDETAFDTFPGGLAIYEMSSDQTVHLLYCNQMVYEMLHYDKEEYLKKVSKDALALIHSHDREQLQRKIQKVAIKGRPLRCQIRIMCKEGDYIWVQLLAHKRADHYGRIIYHAIFMDITEEKHVDESQTRKLIRQEDNYYYALAEESGIIVFEWDVVHHEFMATKGFYSYAIGQENPDCLFKNQGSFDVYHPDDDLIIQSFFNKIKSGSDVSTVEVRLKKITGEFVWCNLSAIIVRNADHTIAKAIGVILDIDAEKRLIQHLQGTENLFENLTNHLSMGIGIFEITNAVKALYLNKNSCEMFGISYEKYQSIVANRKSLKIDLKRLFGKDYIPMSFPPEEHIDRVLCVHQKDKNPIYVRFVAHTVPMDQERYLLYAGMEDVTDTQGVKAIVQQDTENLNDILENLSVGVSVFTFGKRPHTYYINSCGYRLLEFDKLNEPVLEDIDIEQIFPECIHFLRENYFESNSNHSLLHTFSIHTNSGAKRDLFCSINMIQTPEEPVCYCAFRDVTEHMEQVKMNQY